MSEPKNQHTIPQCYLKYFVDTNTPKGHEPYVWIFERESKKGKKKSPKNILAETDFYTLKTKSGGKNYIIEKTLSQIEGEYSKIFREKINKKIPLNNYEHIIFCSFVAAMLQRTTRQKKNIENFYNQMIERVESMEKQHGIEPKKSIELKREMENAFKLGVVELIPRVTDILLKMNVAFLCTKKDSFITSDSPCYLFNSKLQYQKFYGPGLMQKNVEVRMPLSPKVSVCFSWLNNLRGYLGINADLVHDANRMIFGHSHNYFIANSQKTKRRWFRRYPFDPVLLFRILKNKIIPQIKMTLKRKFR